MCACARAPRRACEFLNVCLFVGSTDELVGLSCLGIGCKRANNSNKIATTNQTVHKVQHLRVRVLLFLFFFSLVCGYI